MSETGARPLLAQEVIRHKRDGAILTDAEIEFVVGGIVDGSISEGQVAAFAMAVYFQGLAMTERMALTRAMARSGRIVDWRSAALPGPVLDKHSTGGVGDKVSLILAPLLAACGGFVPMVSGRGLGHTGGTLDKLEAIPGYDTRPDLARLQSVVRETGCAIVGQTDDLAPADRRLYAIRDVTATVESPGLITASILSKKLAAGLDVLVMDVKTGSGAFAAKRDEATALARSIVDVANGAGLKTTALITDMNRVLGTSAGNALEVSEAIDFLTGRARERRLDDVVRALACELLVTGGLAGDMARASALVSDAVASGAAAERFAAMVEALGGPADLLERPERYLPAAPVQVPVFVEQPGWLVAMDVRAFGMAVVGLGGGRRRADDAIDPAVGLSAVAGPGDWLDGTRPLAVVHARSRPDAEAARAALLQAVTLSQERPDLPASVVLERLA